MITPPRTSPPRTSRRAFLGRVALTWAGLVALPGGLGAAARWVTGAARGKRRRAPSGWPGLAAMRRRRRSRRELDLLDLEAPHDLAG